MSLYFRVHSLRNDTTKTGYDLGDPNQRSLNPERVRDLSAPAVCIIRAIMHSVFVWATSRQNQLLSIAEIMNSKVPPENLPEFFWMHLEKDIKCLMQCLGRGVDECAIVIHLVLQQIMLRMKVRENCKYLDVSHDIVAFRSSVSVCCSHYYS